MKFLLALLFSGITTVTAHNCPTITQHVLCTTCIVPACLALSTISQPCDCGATVPSTTVTHDCSTSCYGLSCGGTSYHIVTEAGCAATPTSSVEAGTTADYPGTTTVMNGGNGTMTWPPPTPSQTPPASYTGAAPRVVALPLFGRMLPRVFG